MKRSDEITPKSCGDSLTGMKLGWITTLLLSAAAAGQAGSPSTTGTGQAAAGPGNRVYTNAELHLTFSYPDELVPADPATTSAAGQRIIYGEDTAPDSKPQNSPSCAKVLLSVATPGGSAPSTARGRASIALFDVDLRCLPPKALTNKKAMDNALSNLTSEGTTFMGMMPIEQPLFYQIQGHRVRFAAAQGTPVTRDNLQTADALLIAVVATALEGHVLSWVLQSTDAAAFNRLLKSQVDFGAGKPQPLFPAQFQE